MFDFSIKGQKKKKLSGMVFIELVVLMAIIGVLSTAVGALYTGAQQKARDTQRYSDAAALRSVIEMTYSEEYRYRDPDEISAYILSRRYLHIMPKDPLVYIPRSESFFVKAFFPKVFAKPEDNKQQDKKGYVCHVLNGAENTLFLPISAISAHLGHGDYLGECDGRTLGDDEDDPPTPEEPDSIDCETNTCGAFHYTYGASDNLEGAEGQYYEISILMEHRKNRYESKKDGGNDESRFEVGSGIEIVNTHFDDPDGLPSGVNIYMKEESRAVILE